MRRGVGAGAQLVEHDLEARQRTNAGDQRKLVDRLGEEVVRAAFEATDAVGGLVERGDHHHREMHGGRVGFQTGADFEAVHAGHHDVQQNDVAASIAAELERFGPVRRGNDVEIFGREARFQELDVRKQVVDDQDACGHVAAVSYVLSARKEFTVSRNFATEMGFER